MSRLLPGTSARVLLVALLSVAIALLGLGIVPAAQAAPRAQITGTVTDADGAGIKGIVVTALVYDGDGSWAPVADTTTKKDGGYSLKNLPPATYTVQFEAEDGTYVDEYYDDQREIDRATDVPVAAGQAVSGIDAELELTGVISGTVTDEEGEPLPGIFIDLYTLDEDGFPSGAPVGGTTNDLGRYRIPFAAPGDYVVGFTDLAGDHVSEYYDDQLSIFDAELVPVGPGEDTTGIDAELAPAGHLSGTVTDSEGDGLGGIEVQLAREVGPDEWAGFGEERGFRTEDDGTYRIDGLPAGTWRVGFVDASGDHLSEYYDDVQEFEQATSIEVVAGPDATTGVDAELAAAAHVTGAVTDEDGHPLGGIMVALRALEGDNWSYVGDAETAADGTYAMDGLRPGTNYRVSFESEGEWAPEYWDDSVTIDDATPVDLAHGQTLEDVDAELSRAARITGDVADPDGQPYDFVAVVAYRWTGSEWEDYSLTFTETFDDDAADDTHYDLAGLSPGTYRVEFDAYDQVPDGIRGAAHEFWDDQPSLELAQDVVVTSAGQVLAGYDAVLERGQYPDEVANLTPPTITGAPTVGQELSATTGTWNLKGTTFQYQWLSGTTPVGTGAATYTPTAADVGQPISVVVTAAVAGVGSAAATSSPTTPVTAAAATPVVTPVTTPPTTPVTTPQPSPTSRQVVVVRAPVIRGALTVGTRARVTAGRWNPTDVTLAYRWFVGGKRIPKADGRRLLLKPAWEGKRLRVRVVARADGYLRSVVVTGRSGRIATG